MVASLQIDRLPNPMNSLSDTLSALPPIILFPRPRFAQPRL